MNDAHNPPLLGSRPTLKRSLRTVGITDRRFARNGEDWLARARSLIAGGVSAIVIREKDLPAREVFRMARAIALESRRAGVLLLVNDRIDVAMASGAAGAHLGGSALPIAEARRIVPREFILGVSCHTEADLRAAEVAGADYALLSPVFPPNSKDTAGDPLGVEGFSRLVSGCKMPVVALGGVSASHVRACHDAGATGVAAIGSLFGASDPYAAAREFDIAWQEILTDAGNPGS